MGRLLRSRKMTKQDFTTEVTEDTEKKAAR
jgi:hypothetical protein